MFRIKIKKHDIIVHSVYSQNIYVCNVLNYISLKLVFRDFFKFIFNGKTANNKQ